MDAGKRCFSRKIHWRHPLTPSVGKSCGHKMNSRILLTKLLRYKVNKVDIKEMENWSAEDDVEDLPQTAGTTDELLIKKYSESQARVVRSGMDLSLYSLREHIDSKDYINLSPSFQRRGRWDNKQRSRLIESILLNIPIPPVFLYESDYNRYEVMDGRQRIESIIQFLDNRFELVGLTYWRELNGKRYNEMPEIIQRGILRRTINAIVLLAETKNISDSDIRLVMFDRLNTGGVQLNQQELRSALYPSKFNEAIKILARSENFTELWRIPKKERNEELNPSRSLENNPLYKSMVDCELTLRFFAIRDVINEKRKGALKKILDKTLEDGMEMSTDEVQRQVSLFENSLAGLKLLFDGSDYIELPGSKKLSRPLYDAFTVAFSICIETDREILKEDIKQRLEAAFENKKNYETLVGRGNTTQSIRDRVLLAIKILTEENLS